MCCSFVACNDQILISMADSRLVNSNETSRAQHIAIQGLPVNPFGQGGPAASMITDSRSLESPLNLKYISDIKYCTKLLNPSM